MRFFRGVIGYCIAGMIVMSVWGAIAGKYGILGGVIAAFLIIGPMWFMNHYVGLIENPSDASFVDMALGIAIAGTTRDFFLVGSSSLVEALPTLSLVIVGATLGGVCAALIEKDMAKKSSMSAQELVGDKKSA